MHWLSLGLHLKALLSLLRFFSSFFKNSLFLHLSLPTRLHPPLLYFLSFTGLTPYHSLSRLLFSFSFIFYSFVFNQSFFRNFHLIFVFLFLFSFPSNSFISSFFPRFIFFFVYLLRFTKSKVVRNVIWSACFQGYMKASKTKKKKKKEVERVGRKENCERGTGGRMLK